MAIQDDFSIIYGSAITWKSSGGTYAITCTSLAAAAIRQGVKSATLIAAPPGLSTAVLPDWLEIEFYVQMTSAPAAGGEVNLFLGFSDSATAGTDNPAGLSGTDATGPNVDTLGQLEFAGAIVLSNNLGTGVQLARFTVRPLDQYVIPVVYNNGSVALDATALHTLIQVTPAYRVRST